LKHQELVSLQDQLNKKRQLIKEVIFWSCLGFEHCDESVFPILLIALQMMLTMAVPVACCERSFSKLKLITSEIRAVTECNQL